VWLGWFSGNLGHSIVAVASSVLLLVAAAVA